MPVNNSFRLRKGTSTQWSTTNPVLSLGEPGFDSTNNILKIGNGTSTWSLLDSPTIKYSNGAQISPGGNSLDISTSDSINFSVNGTPSLIIDGDGGDVCINTYLGIGTTSAAYPLDVVGTMKSDGFKSYGTGWFGASDGSLGLGVNVNPAGTFNSSSDFVGLQGFNDAMSSYNPICLTTQNGAQLYLNTDGNVGIGTATPTSKLHVAGSVSMSGPLNVDPQNAGQINCMYVNAGQSIGGTLSTDYLYVNQAITSIDYSGTAIALTDSVTISSDPGANITLYDSASISSNDGANITLTDNIGISCGGDMFLNGYSIILTCDPSATIELNGVVNVNGDLTFDSYTESVVANGNSGASKTLSLASGTVHTCTLTNNCTFTMPTATAGKSFSMFLNSGSGNYTASFSGVRWADSATPTATITPSKVDIYSFISDGTYWYGSFSQNYG